jgi:hypothetical protein
MERTGTPAENVTRVDSSRVRVIASEARPRPAAPRRVKEDSMARLELRSLVRLVVGLSLVAFGASAFAFTIDPKILIEKAFEQNALIVRFSDARAAVVELRMDGAPIASREVVPTHKAGEVTFDLDPAALPAGEHRLEVILYTSAGEKIASNQTTISVTERPMAPVLVRTPKFGEQISGEYTVRVDIGAGVKSPYVSLFIDRQFRQMRNIPPYRFVWDTTKEAQGWHLIEAWAYDASQVTYKSPQIQVYVNNPGGHTERLEPEPPAQEGLLGDPSEGAVDVVDRAGALKGVAGETEPTLRDPDATGAVAPGGVTPIATGALSDVAGFVPLGRASLEKTLGLTGTRMAGQRLAVPGEVALLEVPEVLVQDAEPQVTDRHEDVQPTVTSAVTDKRTTQRDPELSTNRDFVPLVRSDNVLASTNASPKATVEVRAATGLLAVTPGTRLNVDTFTLAYDGEPVPTDVSAHTVEGVPVGPFRHLFEYAGGKVGWDNKAKVVTASKPGTDLRLRIGDLFARVNGKRVTMERAAFIEQGRTMVALTFLRAALAVDIDFDPMTGHVLITSKD